MGWNLTAQPVGFHIKHHENTQILTLSPAPVVQTRQMLTIALTSSANLMTNWAMAGF